MICGIDEAGRGPLAGPVCAAAVILPEGFRKELLRDSKKMSAPAREAARAVICGEALAWGIGWAQASEIDKINIHRAVLLAMKRAYEDMMSRSALRREGGFGLVEAVVDGLYTPDIDAPCRAVVKADSLVPEVMAASIIAKTARDRLMDYYAAFYPEYGYEKHRGYATKTHREAILRFGPSPIQRETFTVKA